ncbi:hypothetical protein [Fodinibius sp. Rm-B-1B1-1]|uniref:hypothetical protein n=1 Tax=Fodinibius alkaliphilus TaxID=3140241 RepID=UPI003159BE76
MGRAMLIICAGLLVSFGIVAIGTSGQGKLLTQKTVEYAQKTQALNASHTAIQIVMQEINDKGIENMDQQYVDDKNSNNSWTSSKVNDADIVFSIEFLNSDWETNPYFEEDRVRLVSQATYDDKYQANVESVYEVAPFSNLVPKFKSSLSIATDNFTISTDGSASLSGNSPSACEDGDQSKPAISVLNENLEDNVQSETNDIDIEGDPKVATDNDLSYEPTDELIERLANTDGVQKLSGNTDDTLGTADNPGVFFVEDGTLKLTGKQKEGYGILVIRDNGNMEYEGDDGATLEVAGNFEWNGLVVFENAYNFDGNGTPTINGSVLVGHTDSDDTINIDLNGNIHMQYDCQAETYAKMAAAGAVKQNKYTRVVTLEETSMK